MGSVFGSCMTERYDASRDVAGENQRPDQRPYAKIHAGEDVSKVDKERRFTYPQQFIDQSKLCL